MAKEKNSLKYVQKNINSYQDYDGSFEINDDAMRKWNERLKEKKNIINKIERLKENHDQSIRKQTLT